MWLLNYPPSYLGVVGGCGLNAHGMGEGGASAHTHQRFHSGRRRRETAGALRSIASRASEGGAGVSDMWRAWLRGSNMLMEAVTERREATHPVVRSEGSLPLLREPAP